MAQCFEVGWRRCSPLNWALGEVAMLKSSSVMLLLVSWYGVSGDLPSTYVAIYRQLMWVLKSINRHMKMYLTY
uniref:Uncharacterized protein n=1 Tax=Vibrio vulnificus TaxID=672 RepID=A0A6S4Q785_VIBVL|nr:hypothetical protein [Vibrio vulnificus]